MIFKLALIGMIGASLLYGGEVIDLGKLEISGTARGPQIHVIEVNQMSDTIVAKFLNWKLKDLEQRLVGVSTDEPSNQKEIKQ